jgi:hypothetical protein
MYESKLQKLQTGLRLLALLVIGTTFVGCGSSGGGGGAPENVPEWYLNTPEDPNYVYAAQTSTSQRMQVAIDKATTGARGDLAASLETKIESMTKSFTEEIDGELRESYTQAQKEITSKVLRGTSPKEKKVFQEDNGTWRAYVLMELPVGKAAQEFLSKMNSSEGEMYTRFRSSQAFKEMKEAVDEYEKEQRQGMSSQGNQ